MDVNNELARKRKRDEIEDILHDKTKKGEDKKNPASQAEVQKKRLKIGDEYTCPICLVSVEKRRIGTPNNCTHRYCLKCLKTWSKRKNTCPICRLKFKKIQVYGRYSRLYIKEIPIRKNSWYVQDAPQQSNSGILEVLANALFNIFGGMFMDVHGS